MVGHRNLKSLIVQKVVKHLKLGQGQSVRCYRKANHYLAPLCLVLPIAMVLHHRSLNWRIVGAFIHHTLAERNQVAADEEDRIGGVVGLVARSWAVGFGLTASNKFAWPTNKPDFMTTLIACVTSQFSSHASH